MGFLYSMYSRFLKSALMPFVLIIGLCFATLALADTPIPSGSGDFGTWIGEVVSDAAAWKGLGLLGIIAILLKLATDLLNVNFVYAAFGKLSATVQLVVIHGLAAVTAGVAVKSSGGTWLQAIGATILASGGAIYLDQILSNLCGLSVNISPAAPPAPSASSGAASS